MPHEPGHINGNAPYKVYGTNEPYSGLTVEIGGYFYTTKGGAFEGDSLQLIANPQVQQQPQQDQQNQLMGAGLGGQAGINPNQDMDNLY